MSELCFQLWMDGGGFHPDQVIDCCLASKYERLHVELCLRGGWCRCRGQSSLSCSLLLAARAASWARFSASALSCLARVSASMRALIAASSRSCCFLTCSLMRTCFRVAALLPPRGIVPASRAASSIPDAAASFLPFPPCALAAGEAPIDFPSLWGIQGHDEVWLGACFRVNAMKGYNRHCRSHTHVYTPAPAHSRHTQHTHNTHNTHNTHITHTHTYTSLHTSADAHQTRLAHNTDYTNTCTRTHAHAPQFSARPTVIPPHNTLHQSIRSMQPFVYYHFLRGFALHRRFFSFHLCFLALLLLTPQLDFCACAYLPHPLAFLQPRISCLA